MVHPDAKLLKLGAKFEFAVVNYHRDTAALDAKGGKFSPHEINVRFEKICAQLDAPRDAIASTRAKTLAGLQVKARAAAWPYGAGEVDTGFPDLDDKVLESIIRDLLMLGGPKVCVGAEPQKGGTIAPLYLKNHRDIDVHGPGSAAMRRRLHADLEAQVALLRGDQAA